MNPIDDLETMLDCFDHKMEQLRGAIIQGYELGRQKGFQEGSEQTRDAIIRAATAPVSTTQFVADNQSPAISKRIRPGREQRAPRGSVRAAILKALSSGPLTETDLGLAAAALDPGVSPRSMGGELRRMRNRLYRFEGGKWFLLAKGGEKETAGVNPAVPFTVTTQEASDDPETAIAA